ncbi:MAG: T9SS type A sorting domain-containing protein [Ignavibacteria bacterium]|nr:T9SS type A sorting domain-containing protein [Ignavibacteria bacterium]
MTYTVTVTDANGCSASDEIFVNVVDVRCGKKNDKVLVCHNGHTICISPNAVETHLNNHGDYLGNCGDQLVTLPMEYELHANYPNPFNPITRIDYSLPYNSKVSIQIFDVVGREVATLVDDKLKAGYYSIDFNASNLSSGIYYYRMIAGDFSAIKKMVLLK